MHLDTDPWANTLTRAQVRDDDTYTNKDGQWITDYPVSSPRAFLLWSAQYPLFFLFCHTKV